MTDIYNLPLNERLLGPILKARAISEGPRTYLRFLDRRYSFAETERITRALARGMKGVGVKRHDMVGLFLPNGPEFVFAWYACCLLGAAMVPINVSYKGFMLENPLTDSGAKGLFLDRSLVASFATADDAVRRRLDWVAVAGGIEGLDLPKGPRRYLAFDELLLAEGPDPEDACDFRDIHSVMYTSGTTGPSKGVLISNAHFFSSASTFLRALRLERSDVLYTPLPLFHGLASRLGVLPALMVGAEVAIGERYSSSGFWKEATESNATVAHTIFTIPPILKAREPGPYDRAHRLRAMYNAHHDPEFEERFGVRLVEAYGMTETGLVFYTPYPERREGSAGRIHEDWEAMLVDDMDMPVPVGEPGEIALRPRLPWIMSQGYLNKPQVTVDTWRNLWFHTGDIARVDADGYFYFVDRKKERIRRRGENVSSWEVEHYVGGHPDVAECVALPHPAAAGEDDIRVLVVARPGKSLTPVALMDWLGERMPHFMVPRYIEIVPQIPRSQTNKVEKYRLFEQGLGPTAWDREAAGYRVARPERGSGRGPGR
ncbi:MAG: AMP-binding protein [Proteobacteria bacterium]|nr:AMP-binding protein [Pseudomonadota bacterium]